MSKRKFSGLVGWLWWFVKLGIVAGVIGGTIYWIRFKPVPVKTHLVERGRLVSEVMGTGTLEARVRATISAKISGRIETVEADQGDVVQQGQLLVSLDAAELEQQVAIADADVQAKQAAIDRVQADITRAAAVLEQAEKNYQRLSALKDRQAISREELDKAAEALAIAQSDTARADAALAEAKQAMIVAQRSLDYQKTRLQDARINSPFAGLIVRRDREPGDVVVPGSPILSLISTDEIWISAWVDETEMAKLSPGQPTRVVFRSEPDKQLPGKLIRLGKETDRETREFIVDVEVLELPENWAVGQRAEVFAEISRKADVLLVPNTYIVRAGGPQGDQTGVFVNRENKVDWQPIELGLRGRLNSEVVTGLAEGQEILLPAQPQQKLRRGQGISRQ